MFLNADGWYVAAPFATMGETLSTEGYQQTDVTGTFYLVDHGTDISSKVHEAEAYTFSDGTITGADVTGTYSVTGGTDDITITLDGKTYQGVLIEMEDEAGNPVLCFSAAGTSNESVWGVKYLKE